MKESENFLYLEDSSPCPSLPSEPFPQVNISPFSFHEKKILCFTAVLKSITNTNTKSNFH